MATGTTRKEAYEIEGFIILEALEGGGQGHQEKHPQSGHHQEGGVWGREPWAFTGLGCRAQHNGRGVPGCGSMSVSYVGA